MIKYLTTFVENAITDGDEDPDKHRKYNEVMGRRCGEHCAVCHPKTGT